MPLLHALQEGAIAVSRFSRVLTTALLAACLVPLASARAAERERAGVAPSAPHALILDPALRAVRAAHAWLARLWALAESTDAGFEGTDGSGGGPSEPGEGVGLDPLGRPRG
jgi:hypothetical protein